MAFEKYLADLQEQIAKFLAIHANPYDTSKHNETAEKLAKVQDALAKAKTTDSAPAPKTTKPTNALGLTEEQVEDKLGKFFESFDKITVTVDGKPVHVEVPYFMNYKGKSHGKWDGATETAGKGTPAELRTWLQKEIDGGKTKAKDAEGLRAYMKAKEMGVDCSGFVSQALNHIADKDGDMDYDKDDAFAPDGTGSGSLKGGAKDFKKIDPANVKVGDTLFYDNKDGVDHIQIVGSTKTEGAVVYYTIFESAGSSGPRKMDWKYEGGQLYRKDGDKWVKKSNQWFGRWAKLEMTVPTGGEIVTDGNQDAPAAKTISDTVGEGGKNIKADVLLVQELLNKNGASLTVDGDCGKKSVAAIKAFQTSKGLPVDGVVIPGKDTWNALNGTAPANTGGGIIDTVIETVKDVVDTVVGAVTDAVTAVVGKSIKKSVGKGGANQAEDVKIVQDLLNKNGAALTVDGDCGNKSIAAIKAFQTKLGMGSPDGLIEPGGKTWQALSGQTTTTPADETASDTADTTTDVKPSGKYFSHPNADNVKVTYGANAKKLNADAEHLLKSILASAGMTEGYVSSTLRTYADQARINYEQNTESEIGQWYGTEVQAVWKKYKAEGKTTAEYAVYLEERDKKRGGLISNHIPGFALDVSPHDKRFSDAAAKLEGKGSGVKKILVEKKCTHTEFTFRVV